MVKPEPKKSKISPSQHSTYPGIGLNSNYYGCDYGHYYD